MKSFKYVSTSILLSFLLVGCGGGSSSGEDTGETGVDDTVIEENETDDTITEDTGSDDNQTDDTGTEDTETEDTETEDNGTDDNETDDNETDDNETTDDPSVTVTNYTYTRVIEGKTLTVNFTATETHQNRADLTKLRVWDYLNPAVIKNGSSEEKIYLYDQYTDYDGQGFTKDDTYRKDTHTFSTLDTVKSNQFIMVTSEVINSGSGDSYLSSIQHNKIESQTFSNDTPPELIDEEFLRIIEAIDNIGPCDESPKISLGIFAQYVAKGFWQIGDNFKLESDIHSPAFQCIDNIPQYLGHVSFLSTATSELTASLNQITIQGKSFNSVLEYSDTEKLVNQTTGKEITTKSGKSYMQFHTGKVANSFESCLISQSSSLNDICSKTEEVSSNLPTTPVTN